MTLKSCLVLFSIKPMITLTNLRKKQQNGYRGAGFGRGQVSEFFGRSPRHREMVPAHRGRTSRHREMVPAHRRRASRWRETVSAHRGRSSRHREMVSAHRGRSSRYREMVSAHRGRSSRHREMVSAHRGRPSQFNPLCPLGISPSRQGEMDSDRCCSAPPEARGSSPEG